MIKILILLPILLLGFISSCSKTQKKTFHTVDYYSDNPKIRDRRIKECKAMTEMTNSIQKDCEHAYESTHHTAPLLDLTKHYGKPL